MGHNAIVVALVVLGCQIYGGLADVYLMVWCAASCSVCLAAYRFPMTPQLPTCVCTQTSTYTFDPIPDVPADFGPDIGDGIQGYLRVRLRPAAQEKEHLPHAFEPDRPQAPLLWHQPLLLQVHVVPSRLMCCNMLQVANPLDSCSPYAVSDFETPWVALIARNQPYKPTNCTFDVKASLWWITPNCFCCWGLV